MARLTFPLGTHQVQAFASATEDIAILIDSPPKIMRLAADFDEDLGSITVSR